MFLTIEVSMRIQCCKNTAPKSHIPTGIKDDFFVGTKHLAIAKVRWLRVGAAA